MLAPTRAQVWPGPRCVGAMMRSWANRLGAPGGDNVQTDRSTVYRCRIPTLLLWGLLFLMSPAMQSQELAPRAFWPAPVGTDVVVLGYQHSSGDIIVDQSLPVTGVDSSIDYLLLSYQHSFDLLGRSASLQLGQAFADGTTEGDFAGQTVRRRTVGPMDSSLRLAVNLRGAPAMNAGEFAARRGDLPALIGASVTVVAPTGDYDPDRVINLGTNRWAVKPSIGAILPLKPGLFLESELSGWWFEDNDEFVSGVREQDPVYAAQLHLVKRFRPGFWGSLDANFYWGGRTRIDGVRNRDLQRNSRFGVTAVYPIHRRHALRLSASVGTVTENGGDFDLFSLSWIHVF